MLLLAAKLHLTLWDPKTATPWAPLSSALCRSLPKFVSVSQCGCLK